VIDTSSLFLHVLGAIGIVGGGLAQVLAGARLRVAATGAQIAAWARFTRTAGLLIAGSAVISLLSGGHLAGAVWTTDARSGFSYPFITLGLAGLMLLAPVGPMLGGARLRRITEAAQATGDAAASREVLDAVRSARLWGPIHSLVGVGIGLVALMVYKPGWIAGAVLLVVTFAGGWIAGSVAAARAEPA
jgi:Predicted integral membrane protein (DUF2269)